MIEQVKIVFFELKRAKASGNMQELRKHVAVRCYEKLKNEMDQLTQTKKSGSLRMR